MQALDPPCNPTIDPPIVDSSLMPENSSPIQSQNVESNLNNEDSVRSKSIGKNKESPGLVVRRERPPRACTQRAAARMQAAAEAMAEAESKRKKAKKRERVELKEESEEERLSEEEEGGNEEENGSRLQCSKIVTPLGGELEPSQLPRWNIRSMWQLASILNFLNVFRPLLKINVEFSAEEFETALLTPNNTLGDVHMPLLKAIPPITRIALGHGTWVTVLCRKLRDWWHWVAEGDLPIVAAHGAEVEAYKALDPGVRVVILKALCDIRVEQDDIRNHIDNSIKQGVRLSAFRKERIGGDSHGVSYWYEDDPVVGHRLYREIRKVEVKKGKGKNVSPIPHSSYHWEAVATNLDEFVNVSEKLITSKNRTEFYVGKKLQNNMLPEIETVHKRKEKKLKKQHRQALMLDNMMSVNGLGGGRSLRDRKPVTYTFDDYDRSINEALKVTKKQQSSPEPFERRDPHLVKLEVPTNGRLRDPSEYSRHNSFSPISPDSLESLDSDEFHDDGGTEPLDRSNRRRQRPQRYSVDDFVEAASDNEAGFDSDDDIVGEAVYDDEYLSRRKQRRKTSSSSEGDDEYHMDEDNPEEEEEEEEDNDDSSSMSEESSGPRSRRRHKPMPSRTRRETKLRSVGERQPGLRRSKRATRNRIDYRQIEMSESDTESMQPRKLNARDEHLDVSDYEELSMGSQDLDENMNEEEAYADQPREENCEVVDEKQAAPQEQSNSGDQESDGGKNRRFLDLNELAPGSGIDEGPTLMRDENEDEDDF